MQLGPRRRSNSGAGSDIHAAIEGAGLVAAFDRHRNLALLVPQHALVHAVVLALAPLRAGRAAGAVGDGHGFQQARIEQVERAVPRAVEVDVVELGGGDGDHRLLFRIDKLQARRLAGVDHVARHDDVIKAVAMTALFMFMRRRMRRQHPRTPYVAGTAQHGFLVARLAGDAVGGDGFAVVGNRQVEVGCGGRCIGNGVNGAGEAEGGEQRGKAGDLHEVSIVGV